MDFIEIEQQMVATGVLPARGDDSASPLGDTEDSFTEYDDRLHALWRISMVRQFHPDVLVRMSEIDLLFLAGQTSTGYPSDGLGGIALEGNKIDQNSLRARAELSRRAGKSSGRRQVFTGLGGVVLGAGLTWPVGSESDDTNSTPSTTSTP